MPTIQVPVYNMRIYSVVGLKIDGITPVLNVTGLHTVKMGIGSLALNGIAPITEPEPITGALALSGLAATVLTVPQPDTRSLQVVGLLPDVINTAFPNPDAGSIITATTDAEFINSGDCNIASKGYAPQLLRNPILGGVGSASISGELPVRAYGLYTTGLQSSGEIVHTRQMLAGSHAIAGLQPSLIRSIFPIIKAPDNALPKLAGLAPRVDLLVTGLGQANLSGKLPSPYQTALPIKKSPQVRDIQLSGQTADRSQAGPPPRPDARSVILNGLQPIVNGAAYIDVGGDALAGNGLQVQIIETSTPIIKYPQERDIQLSGRIPTKEVSDVNKQIEVPIGQLAITGYLLQPSIILPPIYTIVAPQNAEIAAAPKGLDSDTTIDDPINATPNYRYSYFSTYRPTSTLSGTLARIGTMIENDNATTDVPSNYQICDVTGFKVEVDEPFPEDWQGYRMRKKSWTARHPQDFVKGVPEHQPGSEAPEPDDEFVDELYPNGVTADDL